MQLTASERAIITAKSAKNVTPQVIRAYLGKRRKRTNPPQKPPDVGTIQRFIRRRTHNRTKETRGRKRQITKKKFATLNAVRKKLIKEAEAAKEVTLADVKKKSKVKASTSTISRAYLEYGKVKWRAARQKPQRSKEHMKERTEICEGWKHLPAKHFAEDVDIIIDNKRWDAPTSAAARKYLAKQHVRGHLRTRKEGLTEGFTKPNKKKHRMNPGGSVLVTAGLSGDKVVVWETIKGRWNAQAAADMYTGPIKKALKKARPGKTSWKVLEDNDPTGYSAKKAVKAKKTMKLPTMKLPRYSPDLNPWDFTLWENIRVRMAKNAPEGKETVKAFKKRLRSTALRTPRSQVKASVASIRKRIAAVAAAKGGNISID